MSAYEPARIRKSLLRRITWFGGDRRIVGFSGLLYLLTGVMMFRGFGLMYGISIAVPVLLWIGTVWVAREMYQADPWMLDILIRHVFRYKSYYAAKPDHGTEHPMVQDFV